MPAVRRFVVCTLIILPLMWSVAFVRLSPAEGQVGQSPVSTLTQEQKTELDTLDRQGEEASNKGDLKTAEKFYQQGLERATALNDAIYRAQFLNYLGIVNRALGQHEKALGYYTRALALIEKVGTRADVALTLNNLGNVYLDLGLNEKAIEYYTRAVALYEKAGKPESMALPLLNLGVVYAELGENEKAITYFTRALTLYEQIGNQTSIAAVLNNLGLVYSELGQDETALAYHIRALTLREKIGNPAEIATSLNNLGEVYGDLGQNEKALGYYKDALVLFEKIGNPAAIAHSLLGAGAVYGDLGQNDKALDYYTRALVLFEKIGKPADIAGTLNNLGLVYSALGQNEKALDYCKDALVLFEKIGNPADIALAINNLGIIYRALGQNEKAMEFYSQALSLREKIGNPADIAMTLYNLGNVGGALGRHKAALDYYTRALALYEKRGNPATIAHTLLGLGTACWKLGQNEKVLAYYTRALALYEKIGNSADLALARSDLGEFYWGLGNVGEAEKQFAEARRLWEAYSLQVSDPSEVGALQETLPHFYERYAALRLKRNLPEEALEILEAGRGQGLTRQMDLTQRGDITRFFTAEEKAGLTEKTQALREAQIRQRRAEQQAERAAGLRQEALTKQAESAREAARKAEQEVALFRDSLFARYPQLRRSAYNQPAEYPRLKTLAADHPDTLYLEWGVIDDTVTLLFALGSKDGLRPMTLPVGRAALGELERKWRDALEISGGRGIQADRPKEKEKARTDEAALAKQGYQMLLGEVEKAGLLADGRYQRLVLVGSGPLLEMPLAALCNAGGKRLIERYSLSHAFSLSSFFYQHKPAKNATALFCIADPTGEKETPAPKSGQAGRGRSAFREGFLPLPGARTEGKAVAGLFEGSKLLLGPEAREETVTSQLPNYSLLHFATHGFVVPKAIDSGLVLAEEAPESPFNGLLTAKKILNLPLSAQLAVLSACETGRGRLSGGEGLMGLAWAFRAAGCPSLVVSQWAVNDAATKEWMLAFYGALKAGKSKDVAVQVAMLAVKQAHPSPFYWAAFELIGETEGLDLTPRPPSLETLP